MSDLRPVLWATNMLLELAAFGLPLSVRMPRRKGTAWRVPLAVLVFYAGELLQEPIRQAALGTGAEMPLLMATFGITMVEACLALLLVFGVSAWQALFCCTAAYIGQNLITGLSDMLDTLVAASMLPQASREAYLWLALLLVWPVYLGLFARPVRRHNLTDISEPQIILAALVVVATVIGLDVVIKGLGAEVMGMEAYLMARLAHGVLCGFTLFSEQKILAARQLATEREVERRMAAERERQYQLSRKNIDAINVKCHDIKHQIHSLADSGRVADGRALEDLAAEIAIYDSTVKTENPALDVILTEKGLVCSGEKITLAVIADGRALECLEPQEIYSLFGNALDNAIEAVRGIEEPERRLISLNVRRSGTMCVINVENSCDAAPAFRDGVPVTTKADAGSHGFGTRSMRGIVERHGGVLTFGCEDGIFHVDALLPVA